MHFDDTTNSAFQINEWGYKQAQRAFKADFFIETIQISVNAISSILRDLILFEVSKNCPIFDEEGNQVDIVRAGEPHEYLADLLTNYDNELGGGFSESSIYKESKRLKIITPKMLTKLIELYGTRNKITHRLFGSVILKVTPETVTHDEGGIYFNRAERELDMKILKSVAKEYISAFDEILKTAKETASEYDNASK